ncbi:heavy-metal-associated domain-containing protein [Mycolicibacterium goodii]|nr:heavy-metal-associated domain-containing protein [Mycolicibacterium goodii]
MSTTTYAVTGMTCGHCEMSVREEVGAGAGVQEVAVSAATGTLVVRSSGPVDDAQILHAVDEAGYSAEDSRERSGPIGRARRGVGGGVCCRVRHGFGGRACPRADGRASPGW